MKRSAPLRRTTTLRRKRWLRRRPPRRLRTGDPVYLALVRSLPCAGRDLSACSGPHEAHHAGRRGIGQKSKDRETHCLCSGHHRQWHDHAGGFRGWTRAQRRLWSDANILATKLMVRALGQLGEDPYIKLMATAMAARSGA